MLFYDPPGRVVATLNPDASYAKTTFDPWHSDAWDAADTVLLDPRDDPDVRGYVGRYLAALGQAARRLGDLVRPPHRRRARPGRAAGGRADRRARRHADPELARHARPDVPDRRSQPRTGGRPTDGPVLPDAQRAGHPGQRARGARRARPGGHAVRLRDAGRAGRPRRHGHRRRPGAARRHGQAGLCPELPRVRAADRVRRAAPAGARATWPGPASTARRCRRAPSTASPLPTRRPGTCVPGWCGVTTAPGVVRSVGLRLQGEPARTRPGGSPSGTPTRSSTGPSDVPLEQPRVPVGHQLRRAEPAGQHDDAGRQRAAALLRPGEPARAARRPASRGAPRRRRSSSASSTTPAASARWSATATARPRPTPTTR